MAVATQPSLAAQLQNFGQLSNGQKIGLIIAAAALVALFSGAFLWYQAPTYQALYTNLSEKDGGAVINALTQMNVQYKAEGTSTIKVPMDKVYEVRLKLAAQGIPKGGASFDLLDNQKLGVSQFIEQVNYQRALEGELVRTIEAISVVQGARVHLAIPRPSVFLRDQQKPSASVFLNLGGSKRLDPTQVSGIVHLVSSSVADLSAQNISVIDQNGNLLIAPDVHGNKAGLDPTQLEFLHQLEASFIARIESIVRPIVGAGNVRAQVTADLDFSQTEQTAETFKPNPTPQESAIRSQQTSGSGGGAGPTAQGVPGALSNQPPGTATAPITAAPGSAPVGGGTAAVTTPSATPEGGNRESTVNYELDKTVKRTRLPVGSVKRLSAAVVVNYKSKTAEDGKVSLTPLTAAELTQVNNLVKEAMGFNQQRGDSLNVVNAAFNLPPPETVEEISFWEKPAFEARVLAVLKFVGIAIVLWLLVTRFLMPILRQLAIPPPQAPVEERPQQTARETVVYQDNLQAARQIARQDPKVVATVVKEWVGSE